MWRRALSHLLFALLVALVALALSASAQDTPDNVEDAGAVGGAGHAQVAFDATTGDSKYAEADGSEQETLTEAEAESDPDGDAAYEAYAKACEPLDEAQALFLSMQPRPNAHLPKELGGVSPSTGLGDSLGWGHDGPLSTALRLLPRFLSTLNPLHLISRLPTDRRRPSRTATERGDRLLALVAEAEAAGCTEATVFRADVRMFPPRGVRQDIGEAFTAYKDYLDVSSDAHSQFMVGFMYATGLGGERDQAKATLYYTFAALQGHKPAQMAMGYRYWAGIGVKEDCLIALNYYESAGKNAYDVFTAGPPGGRTQLLTRTRLSDRYGGVFGPYASWASTGANGMRQAITAIKAAATGESAAEVLEFYQYRSDRDLLSATVRLGRFFYLGSVSPHLTGISSGAEAVSEIPQDFDKARRYFYHVARKLWPVDFDQNDKPALKKRLTKEAEDRIQEFAKIAASFLGRMALRGEGMKQNYRLARLWYERAATLGDPEAHNGLGIIYRDGLGTPKDADKAFSYFEHAARFDLPEAKVNVAKMFLAKGEHGNAIQFLEGALRSGGSPFEGFHLLANLHATAARNPTTQQAGGCGVAVSYYKLVSETGAWDDDYLGEADRAWGRGEEEKAMLGWWIAAEMGYEAGQNNVAFLLSRGVTLGVPSDALPDDTSLALWTRSSAQGNADAMVMVGDHYYRGDVPSSESNGTVGPDYSRAFAYYQSAADKSSSMAYWNLGYMYENAQGVPRDWHLAKHHYDLSVDASHDAYLPWLLSLTKLYVRSWWTDMVTRGAVPGLPLFEDEGDNPGAWESIKKLFMGQPLDDGVADEYEDYSGAGWGPGEDDGDGDDPMDTPLDDDDILETLVILGIVCLITGLVWFRGQWAAQGVPGQ